MEVKGNHVFHVSKDQLWGYLMDPEVLAKITPGVSRLETIGPDSYQTVSDIKIGPVKGSFKGKLNVIDKDPPNAFAIEMDQQSKIGNAQAKIQMNISDKDGGLTELSFAGKARLSGVIARTGQRVLSGVANTITREVFASLEEHIKEQDDTGPSTVVNTTDIYESEKDTTQTHTEPTTTAVGQAATSVVETADTMTQVTESKGGLLSWLSNIFKNLFN